MQTDQRTQAALLLDLLGQVGVGPNKLILTPQNIPHDVDAETAQEAHSVQCETRADGGKEMVFFLVLNDLQTKRIFPNGIEEPPCEHGWQMMLDLLDWAAKNMSTSITGAFFSETIEGTITDQNKKSEARPFLPDMLFDDEPGRQDNAGFATAMFYAMEDAGEIPRGTADKLGTFCQRCPDLAINVLAPISELLLKLAETASKHPDVVVNNVSISLSAPKTSPGSLFMAGIGGQGPSLITNHNCEEFLSRLGEPRRGSVPKRD